MVTTEVQGFGAKGSSSLPRLSSTFSSFPLCRLYQFVHHHSFDSTLFDNLHRLDSNLLDNFDRRLRVW